jgi:quercetin dioxygenase-like cupin family protein
LIFSDSIMQLPEADLSLPGLTAYLSQADHHQVIFMQYREDLELQEHAHEEQWGVVLDGAIDLVIDGVKHKYFKGDRYVIPSGAVHSGKIYAGYADVTFINEPGRYHAK